MNPHKTITLPGLLLCAAALPAQAQVHARPDRIGDALQYLVPAGAAGLALYECDTEGLKELAYSLALSQGSTEVLKRVVDSKRPDGTGRGFPSGHTSAVFASAAFVHERYGVEMALPYYALATLTAYSRVHTHHHFTKDVVGGAAVGVGSSFLLTHPFGPRTSASVSYASDGVWARFASAW
jgi:membrane-associated phospholipid phosphatase